MRVAVFACAVALVAASASSPAFFWSPVAVDAIAKEQSSASFNWDSLRGLVSSVCAADAATPVEAFVLFTLEKFSTADFNAAAKPFSAGPAGGAMSSVYAGVSSAAASASFPYASLAGERLSERIVRFGSSSGVSVVSHAVFQEVSKSAQSTAALTNGKCDVIVIPLRGEYSAAHDEVIGNTIREVAAGTGGSYAVGVVGQASADESVSSHAAARMLLSSNKKLFVYMTPDIFAGLLIGLLVFVTTLVGVCCLHNVQTPTQFCHEPLPAGKEF